MSTLFDVFFNFFFNLSQASKGFDRHGEHFCQQFQIVAGGITSCLQIDSTSIFLAT